MWMSMGMFPVAKCETRFTGDMEGKTDYFFFFFFLVRDKGFLALGIPAAAAVDIGEMGLVCFGFVLFTYIFFLKRKDTQVSGYVIHNI